MSGREFQDLNATEKELLVRFLVTMIGVAKEVGLPRKAVEDGIDRLWDRVDEKKYGILGQFNSGSACYHGHGTTVHTNAGPVDVCSNCGRSKKR